MTYTGDRFKKIDRDDKRIKKPWLGHKFVRSDQIVHEFRCWICGKWYNYSTKDIPAIMAQGRWDPRKKQPKHCGNSHCEDWMRRHEEYNAWLNQGSIQERAMKLFMDLKKKRMVS